MRKVIQKAGLFFGTKNHGSVVPPLPSMPTLWVGATMARGRLFHVHCGRATLAFALRARGASTALGDVFRRGW